MQLLAEHQEYHCGYVDEAGKTIVTPKFTGARSFSEGLAAVEEGIKWGFIDHTGKFVIKPQY
ncbi:WG repeat-containing protein, partial [Enterococcus faecium]